MAHIAATITAMTMRPGARSPILGRSTSVVEVTSRAGVLEDESTDQQPGGRQGGEQVPRVRVADGEVDEQGSTE